MKTNQCVDVLVGLQFGSEGKGKIAAMLAGDYAASVRVGAPNAGHTVIHEGQTYKMRTIPCAWVNPKCALYIGAGGMINMDVLERELMELRGFKFDHDTMGIAKRLRIDVNAGIVTQSDIHEEEQNQMYENIGSTCEGIGVAMARKVLRRTATTANQVKELQPFLTNVGTELNNLVDRGHAILVEGTQGYGLSLNHGYYPYVTSRDVLASSILGECGLAPATVRRVIGVMRTYPIRVQGKSGDMGAEELSWDQVAKESGYTQLVEKTTVTGRIRRVSRINWDLLVAAVHANRPTEIALMFADYCDSNDRGKSEWSLLSEKTREFVHQVEAKLNVPVTMVSTGPESKDTVLRYNHDGGGHNGTRC